MSEILGKTTNGEGSGGANPADLIKDASIETFEEDVLNASMTTPVIVDFWADWCGPCKQLAPVLEQAVRDAGGKARLVKIDIDKNQMLAAQLRIQSIPTVYGFYQGRPVDGFQGAVPPSEVKAFIDRLAKLTEGRKGTDSSSKDDLNAGDAAFENGDMAAAAQFYAQVMQAESDNVRAIAGLAKCYLAMGDAEKARQTLEQAPLEKQTDPALTGIKAALSLAEENAEGDPVELAARVDADPDDLEARFDLAAAHLSAGAMEKAMDALLAIIERDRDWNEEAARKKLLTVFEALGPTNPATLRGRRRLSSILFS